MLGNCKNIFIILNTKDFEVKSKPQESIVFWNENNNKIIVQNEFVILPYVKKV